MMTGYYLKCLGGDVYIYELRHCLSDILLRHSILQLRSIVIFDNFINQINQISPSCATKVASVIKHYI